MDWVSGASMILRRQVLEQIGPMDDAYFLSFEEVDFLLSCPRGRLVGVVRAGIAGAASRRGIDRYPRCRQASRRILVRLAPPILRHTPRRRRPAAGDLLWAAGRLSFLLRAAFGLTKQGGHADPQHFMFDLLWGDLRALLSGRARTGSQPGARP